MIISNGQISLRNLCEKAHDFRYRLQREPKEISLALYRGVLGHSALEAYYNQMRDGKSVDECLSSALAVIDSELTRISTLKEEFHKLDYIMKLRRLLQQYAERYKTETFKVLEVEKDYSTKLDSGIDYILRLDLLVEMTSGEYRGDLVVVDHKFVYNFKTILDIRMDAQLPKYIKTLRNNDIFITKGMFNQIRTRDIKSPSMDQLFRREWVTPKRAEVNRIWFEQEKTALKIQRDQNDLDYVPVRVMNSKICRDCPFQLPCEAELDGTDITQMLDVKFKKVHSPIRESFDLSDVA